MAVADTFDDRCRAVLVALDLCSPHDAITVDRLTGGVASDIAAVSVGSRTVCIKFALAKLQVEDDWFAPVHRSRAEYAWLEFASGIVEGAVPKLYGWSEAENGFAMAYVSGQDVSLWKADLLAGVQPAGEAERVADIIGRIHAASTRDGFDAEPFRNAEDFEAIRIEPYLRFSAERHPDIAPQIIRIADALGRANAALVHGDVSPKNILLQSGQPILLDAECATMGDPAFDVAFCLNHLVLKSFHLPALKDSLRSEVLAFWATYRSHVTWEDPARMQERVAHLLPMLMLARVDGKSPVEYLSEANRQEVRTVSCGLISEPVEDLQALLISLEKGFAA